MNDCPFCTNDHAAPPDAPPPPGFLRRTWRASQWLFPSTLLLLLPKCPMCVMAYLAFFTGIGVSITTARYIHHALLFFCLASLAYLLLRLCRRLSGARIPSNYGPSGNES